MKTVVVVVVVDKVSRDVDVIFMFIAGGDLTLALGGVGGVGGWEVIGGGVKEGWGIWGLSGSGWGKGWGWGVGCAKGEGWGEARVGVGRGWE